MQSRLSGYVHSFPRQLWVMAAGSFISTLGRSLVFVFLTLYMRQRFGVSMAEIGLVWTLNSIASLAAGVAGGVLSDRLGRRAVMLLSLFGSGVVLLLMGIVSSFGLLVALVTMLGLTSPLFQPARDAMVADLTPPEQRTEAYGGLRVASNLGFAIGPALGGFLAAVSYGLLFALAASSSLIVFVMTLMFIRETRAAASGAGRPTIPLTGLGPVLRDRVFLAFCGLLLLTGIVYSQFGTNLPVYIKEQFGLGEQYFGWMMAANGAGVVLLQMWVSRKVEHRRRLPTMALGAGFYAVGSASFAILTGFPAFLIPVIIYTIGEVIVSPVAVAFVAELSPVEMRGRYMGIMAMAWWGIPYGIGPVVGGAIYDAGLARELWLLVGGVGLLAALGYLGLETRWQARRRTGGAA